MNAALDANDTTRMEIQAAVANFMQTFNGQDVDAIVDLYTDDCQVIAPGRAPVVGKEALRAFWRRTIEEVGMKDIDYEILGIEPMGPDHAGELTRFTGTLGGRRVSGGYLVNWRREGGRWRLHQDVFNAA